MKTTKMGLANIKGRLSRTEMKSLTGGMAPGGSSHTSTCCPFCKII